MTLDRNCPRKAMALRGAGLVLAWVASALLPFAATGCKREATPAEKSDAVEVGTTNPVRRNLTREVQQPGHLRPYEQTPIYTKLGGFAKEPNYDIGDCVRKGALLVEIDVPEVVAELDVKKTKIGLAEADREQAVENANAAKEAVAAARADVTAKLAVIDSAEAEMLRWKGEADRARNLFVKGIYDQSTLDQDVNQWKSSIAKRDEAKANKGSADANLLRATAFWGKAKADINVADANIKVAKAAYKQWDDWLAYRYITAPFDGVVTLRNVHSGHFLQPVNSGSTSKAAEPLFVLMRTDTMRCVVEVPELDAMLVKDGDKAVIHFDAMPGIETIGIVKRNSGSLDEHTRTLRVEVWLNNPSGATVNYTASKEGVITSVDPTPPNGGNGYPPNTTIPLVIAGGKNAGINGVVNATTNSAGVVISYSLSTPGSRYKPGGKMNAATISNVLRPYMYAHVTILGEVKNAWTVPADAVQSDILANNGRSYVFLIEGGKASKVFVQVGARCAEGWQILRKQRPGSPRWEEITGQEIVVTTNTKALQDGQALRIKSTE
jgi:HlyD family secretion protein